MDSIRLDELTALDVERLLSGGKKKYGIFLPVGCTEQHGPDLPIGCDTAIARGAANNAAMNFIEHQQYGAVVLPDLAYTPSPGAESTIGTVSVSFDFLGRSLFEVLTASLKTPWQFVAVFNGHAHNHGRVIETSIAGAQGTLGRRIPIVIVNIYEFSYFGGDFDLCPGSHAGELEIALYNYYAKQCRETSRLGGWTSSRPRPEKIYGLDILARSNSGVLSEKRPDMARSLAVSHELGRKIDEKVSDLITSNLDTYFSNWIC